MSAWLAALLPFLKPVILPILSMLVGWLLPSPLRRSVKIPAEVRDAQEKADKGNPDDLDRP